MNVAAEISYILYIILAAHEYAKAEVYTSGEF